MTWGDHHSTSLSFHSWSNPKKTRTSGFEQRRYLASDWTRPLAIHVLKSKQVANYIVYYCWLTHQFISLFCLRSRIKWALTNFLLIKQSLLNIRTPSCAIQSIDCTFNTKNRTPILCCYPKWTKQKSICICPIY